MYYILYYNILLYYIIVMNVHIVKEDEYEFNNFIYSVKNSLDENVCNEEVCFEDSL